MLNRGLAKLTADAINEAMRVPVAEGPVMFIGAPWQINDPKTGLVKGYHVAPSVQTGEGW